jgi:hypothetical protein
MTSTVTSPLKIIRGKAGRALLRSAEQAHTPLARTKLEEAITEQVGEVEWKQFGGTGRVAHSAIGVTGNALHLAGEPIINQGDALIELRREMARLEGDGHEPASPQEAASYYFGLPSGGMAEWDTRKGKGRDLLKEVASLSQLVVHKGSNKGEATLVFLDQGIGQNPASFESTILSLQKGLKAEIPYLAGQFGHGAGLTLNFSNGGQILVGRRHPHLLEDDQEDLVGLTIVRKFLPSEVNSVHPAYRYLVDKQTGQPIAFEPSALGDPRWHGLRRICIDYEMGTAADRIGDAASGGLYYHLDNLLPCPPLPYAYRDERGDAPQWRRMRGNAARLTTRARGGSGKAGKDPIKVTGPIRTTVDVTAAADDGYEYGTVEISAWIIEQEKSRKGNELFGPASTAETWSLNGQMHDAESRDRFARKPIELDALKNHLKVNVECDGLTPDAKADIFTTGRQGTAERRAKTALQNAIASVLANNPELRARNQEIRDEALRRATAGADRELEKALSDFQHFFEQEVEVSMGTGKKKQRRKKRKGKKPTIAPPPPIAPLHSEPTFLKFRKVVKSKLRVRPGHTASIQLEADAVDGYFPNKEKVQFGTTPDLGSTIRISATERLAGGRMRIYIRGHKTASPGKAILTASCLPASAKGLITDSIEIEISQPSSGESSGGEGKRKVKKKLAPPHRVLWKEDSSGNGWADEGVNWSEETIGEFKNGVALVNGDFGPFRQMLDQIKFEQRESIIRLYVPPLVMSLVSLDKSEKEPPKDAEGKTIDFHSDYKYSALRSVALGSIFTIRRLRKLGIGIEDSE